MVILETLRVASKFVARAPNHGILRMFISVVGGQLLARIDRRVGHVCILKFSDLMWKLKNPRWKIAEAFTLHVTPPLFFELGHLPKSTSPLIDSLEHFSDRLPPLLGSISIAYLERKGSETD